jgi:hypothetical protein
LNFHLPPISAPPPKKSPKFSLGFL